VHDWHEVYLDQTAPEVIDETRKQASRCMDCGIPFCNQGCPLGNIIPDWNDLVYRGNWNEAIKRLHATNNFPEFTGRVCPAPCEGSCVLGINADPVTIKQVEVSIIERAFQEGWVHAAPPEVRTGKKVAVVGSGPAGLAAAAQLNHAGHYVTVFERADRIGGLLRYGIPEFKMEKNVLDRRLNLMAVEGVSFRTSANVGINVSVDELKKEFDSILLAGGSTAPRDLPIEGRDLKGIYFAMEYLPLQNKRCEGDTIPDDQFISARDKRVVIIGGGDTGADCLGTAHRQGALSVTQFELLPMPPDVERNPVWPFWPTRLRTSSSHEEGVNRDWSVATKEFIGSNNRVTALRAVRLEWKEGKPHEVPGSQIDMPADLVLLAMGFVSPLQSMLEEFGVEKDARSNVKADTEGPKAYATSVPKVFAAGDMRRGQSLVVWAIREGRQCARAVDEFLMGDSVLPR